jgi:hypothetical protein
MVAAVPETSTAAALSTIRVRPLVVLPINAPRIIPRVIGTSSYISTFPFRLTKPITGVRCVIGPYPRYCRREWDYRILHVTVILDNKYCAR